MNGDSTQPNLTLEEVIEKSDYTKDNLTKEGLERLLAEFGDRIDHREAYVDLYNDTTSKVHVGECVLVDGDIDVKFKHTGSFDFDSSEYHYDGIIPRLESRFELIADRWQSKSGANRHDPLLYNYRPEIYIDYLSLMDLYDDGLYAIKTVESREDDTQPSDKLRDKAKLGTTRMQAGKLAVAIREHGGIEEIDIDRLKRAVEKYQISSDSRISPSSSTLRQDLKDEFVKVPLQPL